LTYCRSECLLVTRNSSNRSAELFAGDDRVVALFVVGSVGRSAADASSDLDLLVATVDDEAQRSLIVDWRAWATAITPWVYGRCLRDKVVSLVTPGWERLDVSVVSAASTNHMMSGPATCLFDRLGVEPPSPPIAEAPDVQALAVRVENFIRALGLLVTDLERQEFTVLTWASEFMIQELVDVMFLTAGRPRRTVKRIYVDLPQADREVLQSIPRPGPTREGILASHLATAAEYLPRARALVAATGGDWPEAFESATEAYLFEHLGVGLGPGQSPLDSETSRSSP
jgi:hypothetical protein